MDGAACGAASSPPLLTVRVSHGRDTHELLVAADATVGALKEVLATRTEALARMMKLIVKGKTLAPDTATLASCGVGHGARIMMLAGGAGTVSTGAAALSAARAQRQPAAAAPPPPPPPGAEAARRAAWARTGSVSLRDAALREVPADVWAVGETARVLDLSGNAQLCGVGAQLAQLRGLTRLALVGCSLRDDALAWGALCGLRSLAVLLLDRNALTRLPEALGALPALARLSVAHNALTELPSSLGHLAALTSLDVSHNALRELPAELGACRALQEVHASNNALTALPAALGACASLVLLHADSCRVTAAGVPPALLRAPALHTLSLHGNPLTAEQLRAVDGYDELDARRRAKADKALEGRVLGATAAFDEGADTHAFRKF